MMRTTLPIILLAACTGEIGGDDGTPDPTPKTHVAVVVRDAYFPIADVQVIFQNADDSVLLDARTAADGRISTEMPLGGNVTVIRTYPPAPIAAESKPAEVYTYVGVKAGDELHVVGELDMERGTPSAINVKLPMDTEGTVTIETPCGGGQGTGTTIPITVMGCAQSTPFYVMNGTTSFVMRATVSENVDLSGGSFSDRLGQTISATNIPMDIASVVVEKRVQADAYQLFSSGNRRVDQTPATVDMPDVQGVEDVTVATLARTTGGSQIAVARTPYTVSPTVFDAGAVARLPYTSKVMYSPTGISWSEDGAGAVDFVIARLDVQRPDPTGGPYDVHYIHTIVAPHTSTNLRMPALPNPTYNTIADDTIAGRLGLVQVTGGYDGARKNLFAYPAISDIAPMNGTAIISYSGTAP